MDRAKRAHRGASQPQSPEELFDQLRESRRLIVMHHVPAVVEPDFAQVAERRFALGDIAAIDVNLARIDAARSTARLVSARADLTAAVGTLRSLLRMASGALERGR